MVMRIPEGGGAGTRGGSGSGKKLQPHEKKFNDILKPSKPIKKKPQVISSIPQSRADAARKAAERKAAEAKKYEDSKIGKAKVSGKPQGLTKKARTADEARQLNNKRINKADDRATRTVVTSRTPNTVVGYITSKYPKVPVKKKS